MKEKALELKKQIFPLKEYIETLDDSEIKLLNALEKELGSIKLNKNENEWLNDSFGNWYSELLKVETSILIKPDEDCTL